MELPFASVRLKTGWHFLVEWEDVASYKEYYGNDFKRVTKNQFAGRIGFLRRRKRLQRESIKIM